ncbi:MAG: DUF1648 domain-containing protein [Chloroflexi bacterium]|nr:DUF1648 domain-containing protein [Chloroflexota bacterium]
MSATRASLRGRATWRSAASPGGLIGLLCLLACLALTLFLFYRVLPSQETPGMRAVLVVAVVVGAALAISLAYLLYAYFTLIYVLDRQVLTIRWGWARFVVPLGEIEFVGPAQHVLEGQRSGPSVPWPGYYLEAFPLADGASVRTFATQPLHRQVAVCTGTAIYLLSPDRPVRFMEELVRLRERVAQAPATVERPDPAALPVGATQQLPVVAPVPERRRRPRRPEATEPASSAEQATTGGRLSAPLGVLGDRTGRLLLGLAGAINLSMVAYIFWKLPGQPDRIALHFNALGQVDRIGQPREILLLPALMLGVVLVNALLALSVQRYDAFAARLLLGGPILTGCVAWVAVVNVL